MKPIRWLFFDLIFNESLNVYRGNTEREVFDALDEKVGAVGANDVTKARMCMAFFHLPDSVDASSPMESLFHALVENGVASWRRRDNKICPEWTFNYSKNDLTRRVVKRGKNRMTEEGNAVHKAMLNVLHERRRNNPELALAIAKKAGAASKAWCASLSPEERKEIYRQRILTRSLNRKRRLEEKEKEKELNKQ